MISKFYILASLFGTIMGFEVLAFEYATHFGLLNSTDKIIYYVFMAISELTVIALIMCARCNIRGGQSDLNTLTRLLFFAIMILCFAVPIIAITLIGHIIITKQ